jgi:hypothetical protein
MPNIKILQAAAERRQARFAHAQRVYDSYAEHVPDIIRDLNGPSQADHQRAIRLLTQMSFLIVPQLIQALQDPTLVEEAVDEVVHLLGEAGDRSASGWLWEHLQRVQTDPRRSTLTALSLARLGDDRVLPVVKKGLDYDSPECILNALAALRCVGQIEDVTRLRAIHRASSNYGDRSREVRKGALNAILAILDEVGGHTSDRVLEGIRSNFADRALWKDISAYTEYSY